MKISDILNIINLSNDNEYVNIHDLYRDTYKKIINMVNNNDEYKYSYKYNKTSNNKLTLILQGIYKQAIINIFFLIEYEKIGENIKRKNITLLSPFNNYSFEDLFNEKINFYKLGHIYNKKYISENEYVKIKNYLNYFISNIEHNKKIDINYYYNFISLLNKYRKGQLNDIENPEGLKKLEYGDMIGLKNKCNLLKNQIKNQEDIFILDYVEIIDYIYSYIYLSK